MPTISALEEEAMGGAGEVKECTGVCLSITAQLKTETGHITFEPTGNLKNAVRPYEKLG